jgi:hypothetical protein
VVPTREAREKTTLDVEPQGIGRVPMMEFTLETHPPRGKLRGVFCIGDTKIPKEFHTIKYGFHSPPRLKV